MPIIPARLRCLHNGALETKSTTLTMTRVIWAPSSSSPSTKEAITMTETVHPVKVVHIRLPGTWRNLGVQTRRVSSVVAGTLLSVTRTLPGLTICSCPTSWGVSAGLWLRIRLARSTHPRRSAHLDQNTHLQPNLHRRRRLSTVTVGPRPCSIMAYSVGCPLSVLPRSSPRYGFSIPFEEAPTFKTQICLVFACTLSNSGWLLLRRAEWEPYLPSSPSSRWIWTFWTFFSWISFLNDPDPFYSPPLFLSSSIPCAGKQAVIKLACLLAVFEEAHPPPSPCHTTTLSAPPLS